MATDHKGQKKILFNGLAASVRYEIFIFIGRRLAELEMWTLLAKIMQKTKLELHPASEDLEPVGSVFQRPDRPLKVKLTPV
jgi:hypothetical protein